MSEILSRRLRMGGRGTEEGAVVTLGSLFDGIGGWLLAACHAGVTPVWASEIEPFPCSVTARHFPNVKQLGDITQINLDEIEPVDIVCAGSPCQDLSIAGKRKGLCGERSGLFRTAVDLVRRMRERTSGKYPRFFVWESCGERRSGERNCRRNCGLRSNVRQEIHQSGRILCRRFCRSCRLSSRMCGNAHDTMGWTSPYCCNLRHDARG